jgi:threonine aldolase
MTHDPPPSKHQFASDNVSPVCPEAWAALERANHDGAPPYGADPVTARARQLIRDLFETDCDVFFVFNGSAANCLALASICQPYNGVLCHAFSHVHEDEANGPEFFTGGAKLLPVGGPGGKIDAAACVDALKRGHGFHSAKPIALTVTQATEVGTAYTPDELRRLTALRAQPGFADFKFHMDGARLANAVAHLGVAPADVTWRAGIDVLSFGGAKNGCPGTEAVVFFDKVLARDFEWRCKQAGQLASKMRYLSAPWVGLLESGAWRRNAQHANRCAVKLGHDLEQAGYKPAFPVGANLVFAPLPESVARGLQARGWSFYFFENVQAWRLACSWNTDERTIAEFIADLRAVLLGGHSERSSRLPTFLVEHGGQARASSLCPPYKIRVMNGWRQSVRHSAGRSPASNRRRPNCHRGAAPAAGPAGSRN